jgi:hypothetical protein
MNVQPASEKRDILNTVAATKYRNIVYTKYTSQKETVQYTAPTNINNKNSCSKYVNAIVNQQYKYINGPPPKGHFRQWKSKTITALNVKNRNKRAASNMSQSNS